MSSQTEKAFFGMGEEEDDPNQNPYAKADLVRLNTSSDGQVHRSQSDRQQKRKHSDRATLTALYSLRTNHCPICRNHFVFPEIRFLAVSSVGPLLTRLYNSRSGQALIGRRILQTGAPPCWVAVCTKCHSSQMSKAGRLTPDEIVSGFGVNSFVQYCEFVEHLTSTYVMPSYLLKGGGLNDMYIALGWFHHLHPVPTHFEDVEAWWRVAPPHLLEAVGGFVANVRRKSQLDTFDHPMAAGAITLATNLLNELMLEVELPTPHQNHKKVVATMAANTVPVNKATRETAIDHYTNGGNRCQGGCNMDYPVSELRIVCVGGEAQKIREESKSGFRRRFIRLLAQAGFPPEVKILCASCQNKAMSVANRVLDDF